MNRFVKKLSKKFKNFRNDYDSNLNILIVCIAIIMIWKGIWELLDMYIFPNWPLVSNLVCIAIGVCILLIDDGRLGELQEEDPHKERNTKK